MLELLSPAGSPEAVIAAVQNGADAVYMGFGDFNARRGAKNFTEEEFAKAVRYCRVRGCKTYVTLNTLVGDREMDAAVDMARAASELGADAILVQDLGLARVLKQAVPDIPLHASTQMSIHNLEGVKAAAELGMTRAVLARELSLEQIKFICASSPIEIEVFVHGALCFCHSGQCYMSALIGRRSGNRGMCAQPCRMQYTMGGRMDDHPLSLKDSCLVENLQELDQAGVACVKIEGRMKRPEYSAIVTGIYSRAIKENRQPTPDEMEMLETAFSRQGFTQGYFTGNKEDMFGVRPEEQDKGAEKMFNAVRKEYADKEERRVNVRFYTRAQRGKPIQSVCMDEDGHTVACEGPVPEEAVNKKLTAAAIDGHMLKTGGTPYNCVGTESRAEDGLYLSQSAVNELRRELLYKLTEERSKPPVRRSGRMPAMPVGTPCAQEPQAIFQVRTAEQLTPELAALEPGYVYVPADVMADNFSALEPFTAAGTVPVAVLPRVITDGESADVQKTLEKLFDLGVNEALCGNLGHIMLARAAKMKARADFGLNVFNSWTLDTVAKTGVLSATASFEMRLAQVRDLAKTIDTELIVYGRLPLMVSDQCVIKKSAGRCACQTPAQLSDRMGSVFPVVKEYGCRNVIYNAHKLYLADKKEDLFECGLWGMRLLFTTESPAECLEVAKSYCGESDYKPNVLTRGLYYRGVD
jgi:putative protease